MRCIQPRRPGSLLDERQDGIDYGRRHTRNTAELLNDGNKGIDLQRAAALQILQHRHLVADCRAGSREPPIHHLQWNLDSERFIDRPRLEHHCLTERSQRGLGGDAVQRGAGQRTDRIEADVAPELEPDVPADIRAYRRIESRFDKSLTQRQNAARLTSIGFPQRESFEFVMDNDARRDHFARGINHTADRAFRLNVVPLTAAKVH